MSQRKFSLALFLYQFFVNQFLEFCKVFGRKSSFVDNLTVSYDSLSRDGKYGHFLKVDDIRYLVVEEIIIRLGTHYSEEFGVENYMHFYRSSAVEFHLTVVDRRLIKISEPRHKENVESEQDKYYKRNQQS